MDFLTPRLSFKPDGPFYGLVVIYLSQLHGFSELASRGARAAIRRLGLDAFRHHVTQREGVENAEKMIRVAEGGVTDLLEPLVLRSTVGEKVQVDENKLADEILGDHRPAVQFLNRLSAGGLLILAYQTTQDRHTSAPMWQFLRHCRNAAAHRGQFHLLGDEPRFPASWRELEIVRGLQGQQLLTDGNSPGFIGIGDCLHLLSDLEAEYYGAPSSSAADTPGTSG